MWVLIVIAAASQMTGRYVTMQEFTSEFKCQTAAQLIKDNSCQLDLMCTRKSLIAFCVEK